MTKMKTTTRVVHPWRWAKIRTKDPAHLPAQFQKAVEAAAVLNLPAIPRKADLRQAELKAVEVPMTVELVAADAVDVAVDAIVGVVPVAQVAAKAASRAAADRAEAQIQQSANRRHRFKSAARVCRLLRPKVFQSGISIRSATPEISSPIVRP
jgi:hypothetical protein